MKSAPGDVERSDVAVASSKRQRPVGCRGCSPDIEMKRAEMVDGTESRAEVWAEEAVDRASRWIGAVRSVALSKRGSCGRVEGWVGSGRVRMRGAAKRDLERRCRC